VSSLYLFFAKYIFHWGFISRQVPFSKSRIALKAIPPTTLIGALACSYAICKGKGEIIIQSNGSIASGAEILRNIVVAAYARLDLTISAYSDISRVYWLYRGQIKYDAIALEKIYVMPSSKDKYPYIDVIYIIDERKAKTILGENWLKDIIAALWGIRRFGQKETIVSSIDVKWDKAQIVDKRQGYTSFYIPRDAIKDLPDGEYFLHKFFDHKENIIGEYSRAKSIEYIIPYSMEKRCPNKLKVEVSNKGAIVNSRIIDEDIIILRRWLA